MRLMGTAASLFAVLLGMVRAVPAGASAVPPDLTRDRATAASDLAGYGSKTALVPQASLIVAGSVFRIPSALHFGQERRGKYR